MKKVTLIMCFCVLVGLFSCSSTGMSTRMSSGSTVNYDEMQMLLRQGGEYLVLIQPVLGPETKDAFIYIITNEEDFNAATAALTEGMSKREIEKAWKPYSPVMIGSNTYYGNGLGVFEFTSINQTFLYAYTDSTGAFYWGISCPSDMSYGNDIFLTYSSDGPQYYYDDATDIKSLFNQTPGLYGNYISKEKLQKGFIEIGSDERSLVQTERKRSSGYSLNLYSVTYRYEDREIEKVGIKSAPSSIMMASSSGGFIGVSSSTSETYTYTEIVTVEVEEEHNVPFYIYRNGEVVFSDTTPCYVTGLAFDTNYQIQYWSVTKGDWVTYNYGQNFGGRFTDTEYSLNIE